MQIRTNLIRLTGLLAVGALFLTVDATAQQQTIDFEGLVEGQVVSAVYGNGGYGPISVEGINASKATFAGINAAVIFDSNCDGGCTGNDHDLGSPNEMFSGPGKGVGGEGGAFANTEALGNILIVQEDPEAGTIVEIQPGLMGVLDPDDETHDSEITMTFPEPVTLYSFTMIDREYQESQNVELYGEGDVLLGMFDTHVTGDNGVDKVYTDSGDPGSGTAGVVKLVMKHKGSGGLDNIVFTPPPPPGGDCSYTIGFWKTHPEAWPVNALTLGGNVYTQVELLTILNTEPKGDKSLILAHQLIASKLNVANGSDPSEVSDAIAAADAWLATYGIGSGQKKWEGGEDIKNTLDAYNNGSIGPGHCDNTTSKTTQSRQTASLNAAPESFELISSYPNPFNPQTTITFNLATRSNVRLSVFDMLGREIDVLAQGVFEAGSHSALFDAKNLPSGTYLYRLVTPAGVTSGKMILAK